MNRSDILSRVKRLFFVSGPRTAAQAASARARRHDIMAGLQREIRQLQQDISDLSEREGADVSGDGSGPESGEMASLHRELKSKQAELARYQARI